MTLESNNLPYNVHLESDVDFDNTDKQLPKALKNSVPFDSLEVTSLKRGSIGAEY